MKIKHGSFVAKQILLGILLLTLLQVVAPRYVVYGESMQPNLENAERLVVTPITYLLHEPARRDIVVLEDPEGDANDPMLIKRVVGLPGESVMFRLGKLYINGAAIDEPYLDAPCSIFRCPDDTWQLGDNEYFVLGDNRNVSRDSRKFGPVKRETIVGQVLARFWPLEDAGLLTN